VFVTGNKGKVARLELALGLYCRSGYEGSSSDLENERDGCSVLVDQVDLDIPEIQADTVREVALRKALDAFAVLKRPLVVHDCGLTIAALGDWPGPYTKNANDKLGTEGLLKLLAGVEDRRAGWDDTIVYVDENGEAVCFGPGENRENEKSETGWTRYSGEISISPPQKYERFRGPERALGRCFIPTRFGLTECLADVSESEYQRYRREAPSVWNDFAKWWGEKKNENA
jgi:XTP/dITP diphosphohydrolase